MASSTLASEKLSTLVKSSSVNAVARLVGTNPTTLRLLLSGASRPRATTIERLVRVGIETADWFTPAEKEV